MNTTTVKNIFKKKNENHRTPKRSDEHRNKRKEKHAIDELRKTVLSNEVGEERVEVNQRHLIDKILARYSAEFVIYRELMQNSDDAKSTNVQIIFETNSSKKCVRIVFKNNGFLFRPEDWNRLKKIAEGNPDEQKIGAFGVGFYSLFSVCEEPFISSGTQAMAFYWRNDQLFAKKGDITQEDMEWTTFLMDTRRKENLPNIESFGRFLATSLGFTRNLRSVIVCFNDTKVIHLTKEISGSSSIDMKIGIDKFSPGRMFQLKSVEVYNVRLFFKGLIGLTNLPKSQSTYLKIACGNLDVNVPSSFSEEMEFATKKKPPKNTTIQMIFTGYDERNLPEDSDTKALGIFKDLTPFPDQGRIFIGFPTHQTTGCSVHLAARVIPTVERESIDLVHKTLAIYNKEMLCSAGILARIVYDNEMYRISKLCEEINMQSLNSDNETSIVDYPYIQECSVHTLKHFTFKLSTPNNMVAKIIESQFFNCTNAPLPILSTHGVLPIKSVRLPNKEMISFIQTIPMVPISLLTKCSDFFTMAKDTLKCISDISIDDVFEELKRRRLSDNELTNLFKWWIGYCPKNDITDEEFRTFMNLVSIGDDFTPLNHICYFLNPHVIPPDIDVPPNVLPYSISKPLQKEDLEAHFGNWTELTILTWTRYIFENAEIECDPGFAEKILRIISQQFKNLSKSDLDALKKFLADKRCIPTVSGMKIPRESYFPDVKLLPDLSNVSFKLHKTKNIDEFLLFIGVKKQVELQIVLERLFNKGTWNHTELIKYLASIELENQDIKKLETSVIWPNESEGDTKNFMAKELYAPLPKLREFGLPIIRWNGRFYKSSKEAKFILNLGLREYPPLDVMLQLASSSSIYQTTAFEYFLSNFKDRYSEVYCAKLVKVPFLPCMDPNVYSKPSECFFNPECAVMGFNVLRKDLHCRAGELGVEQYPTYLQLLDKLTKEPLENEEKAKLVFEFLSSCTYKFDFSVLSQCKFIPIRCKDLSNKFEYNPPKNCFFKDSSKESLSFADFFSYVDFGDKANVFLRASGVKDKISPTQLAEFLVKSSDAFLKKINGDTEKYISILSKISIELPFIKSNMLLLSGMKRERILLGKNNEKTNNENYELACAKDIYINDNSFYTTMFKSLTCPIDKSLETLYQSLGSCSLNNSVVSSFVTIGTPGITEKSRELYHLIKERFPLFYYNQSQNKIKFPESSMKKLNVMEVEDIKGTYILNKQIKYDSKACKIESNIEKCTFTIHYGDPDLFGIATEISQHVYKKPEPQDISHISILLMMSLDVLKKNGYPVDRMQKERTTNTTVKIPTTTIAKVNQPNNYFEFQDPVNIRPPWKLMSGNGTKPIHGKEDLRKTLRDGVNACCPNSNPLIDSETRLNIESESEKNHCDITPGQSLRLIRVENGMNLYILKQLDAAIILKSTTLKSLRNFIKIIKDLCEVFELDHRTVNIFYDPDVGTIAFNSGKTLYFNLEFYISLHDSNDRTPSIDAMFYWFMSMCHELAHNFVRSHNSDHEFYLSSYCRTYFEKFITKLDRLEILKRKRIK